ncbi:MAG TPA: histone deacetylase [Thermoanaerobaculales bacterium]|nr:histone deacetylase [Thermoanaerobaculales bacterium]
MLRTGIVIDRRYEAHEPGAGHPERPERIAALRAALDGCERGGLLRVEPRAATTEELALVHDPGYLDQVAASAAHQRFAFDGDTWVSSASHHTARLAAGGVLALVDAVMAGEVDNGFACVRPPGHHAEADRAMGFCLFNNVAVAACHLQRRHGLDRVMIVDWDVHHGNGTQHTFDDDPAVLFLSLHQHPFFPGTGGVREVGRGRGEGATVNLPLPAGCGDAEYLRLFESVVDPVCRRFAPQFVLVSAGFDAHRDDPLAGMRMTEQGFGAICRLLLRATAEVAGHRCVAVLEGGYELRALTASVLRVVDELGGERLTEALPSPPADSRVVDPLIAAHRERWGLS